MNYCLDTQVVIHWINPQQTLSITTRLTGEHQGSRRQSRLRSRHDQAWRWGCTAVPMKCSSISHIRSHAWGSNVVFGDRLIVEAISEVLNQKWSSSVSWEAISDTSKLPFCALHGKTTEYQEKRTRSRQKTTGSPEMFPGKEKYKRSTKPLGGKL